MQLRNFDQKVQLFRLIRIFTDYHLAISHFKICLHLNSRVLGASYLLVVADFTLLKRYFE